MAAAAAAAYIRSVMPRVLDSDQRPAAGARWTEGPAQPQLPDGEIHLWLADLDAGRPELEGLLSPAESARAARIAGERERRRWARSRSLLRALLARYLQLEPDALELVAGANGKLALRWPPVEAADAAEEATASPGVRPRCLQFNLSHSAGTALYALAADGPVGVDVELPGRARDVVGIAARTFGADEAARLAALDRSARRQAFLRMWVRHEAELKCLGDGLAGAEGSRRPPLWIAHVEVGDGSAAAVAALRRPQALRCWEWTAARRS
jgi:4'-phosphopantetheinyl transferase